MHESRGFCTARSTLHLRTDSLTRCVTGFENYRCLSLVCRCAPRPRPLIIAAAFRLRRRRRHRRRRRRRCTCSVSCPISKSKQWGIAQAVADFRGRVARSRGLLQVAG